MADVEHDTGFLSIGEVLNLLVDEFPDVTISKIRFLESQGLISPERTASGYRKFYDEDIERLRVILTEQRENFLPLRVIRNRLETGEIDPTGEHLRPSPDEMPDETPTGGHERPVPQPSVTSHPANRTGNGGAPATSPPQGAATNIVRGTRVGRDEFLQLAGLAADELDALESFGVVAPTESGGEMHYDNAALQVAIPAGQFLRAGVDSRHLRQWRTAAEREASLYEQIVAPRFRQRNPEATAQAVEQLKQLDALGIRLRNALMQQLLGRHFE